MYGERLRMLRKESGLTMKEFGKKFNLAESTISGYETEIRKPDMDTIQLFADFYDVSTDYLLGRTDIRNPESDDGGEMYFWDKENVTEDEMKEALAFIKARRMMKEQQNKDDK